MRASHDRAARSEERVAIYHLSVKLVTRGAGRSATAAAAYRAATRIQDERTGLVFDYSRKRGVEHSEIVLPSATREAAWAHDRARLWNAAELAEKRKDARVAREYEVALPHELNAAQRRDLVRAFAQDLAERHGGAIDVAIHRPHREGDTRNHHAHLLATTRVVGDSGLGAKTAIEWKDADRAQRGLEAGRIEVTAIRSRWAAIVNEHLQEHGHAARIDHRTLEAQGVDREPTYHKGPAVTAIERRGENARVTERMREDIGERLQLAAERGRLERESNELARSIVDTTADLKAAITARAAERIAPPDEASQPPPSSMADVRRDARTQWLALIAEQGRAERQATEAHRTSVIDLTGNVAAATASHTTAATATTTREQAQARWLIHHAEHSTGRDDERQATTPEQGKASVAQADDDLAK
jgi:ATP-dependent exoDNAse (exonuclease V) alpha subunit